MGGNKMNKKEKNTHIAQTPYTQFIIQFTQMPTDFQILTVSKLLWTHLIED